MKRASCSARAYFATGGLASLISVIGSLSPAQARTLGPLKPSAMGMNRTDCTALRTERPEPRDFVAALRRRRHSKAVSARIRYESSGSYRLLRALRNPMRTRLPSCVAVSSSNLLAPPGFARPGTISKS